MIRKLAMAESRWQHWADTPRLDTGYAKNQPNWPYWVQPQYYTATDWVSMSEWVRATFGDTAWSDQDKGRWVGSNRKFWFREESDRTLFVLKWS